MRWNILDEDTVKEETVNCDLDLHRYRTEGILLQTRKLVSSLPTSPLAMTLTHISLDLE